MFISLTTHNQAVNMLGGDDKSQYFWLKLALNWCWIVTYVQFIKVLTCRYRNNIINFYNGEKNIFTLFVFFMTFSDTTAINLMWFE